MFDQSTQPETGNDELHYSDTYPVDLVIDYPERSDRVSVLFRPFLALPVLVLLFLLADPDALFRKNIIEWWAHWYNMMVDYARETPTFSFLLYMLPASLFFFSLQWKSVWQVTGFAFLPAVFMIVFRRKYPRWWFDWNNQLVRFSIRVFTYAFLLRDEYPSTTDEQAVHVRLEYPDAERDLRRWLPLVKWFLAIPHIFVLMFFYLGLFFSTMIAWFAILATGRIPLSLFRYAVGVMRYTLRVNAYSALLVTDRYPPFILDQE